MDYGALFTRAWNIIWEHKFLILLGVLVVLGNAGGSGGAQNRLSDFGEDAPITQPPAFDFNFQLPFEGFEYPTLAAGMAFIVIGIILVLALAFWVLSLTARGGLIYGANTIQAGNTSSFGEAFSAGWRKAPRLIGIGIVPALPAFLLFVLAILTLVPVRALGSIGTGLPLRSANVVLTSLAIALACVLALIAAALALLRTFANRACMLEDLGVIDSYRRGLAVLGQEFGSALILFILQVLLSLALGLIFLLPGIIISLCCLLWPVLLIVEGAFAAFYSTLWTLAWVQWTSEPALPQASAA